MLLYIGGTNIGKRANVPSILKCSGNPVEGLQVRSLVWPHSFGTGQVALPVAWPLWDQT